MRFSIAHFSACERGNMALITAGVAIPLLVALLGALEVAARVQIRNNMQSSSDYAVLAALSTESRSWRKQQQQARRVFHANLIGRERLDHLQTRLQRKFKRGKKIMQYVAVAKVDSFFGELSPFGKGYIMVTSTGTASRYGNSPARLLPNSSTNTSTLGKWPG